MEDSFLEKLNQSIMPLLGRGIIAFLKDDILRINYTTVASEEMLDKIASYVASIYKNCKIYIISNSEIVYLTFSELELENLQEKFKTYKVFIVQ